MSEQALRAALEVAIDRGVAAWQEGHCQEIECGCVAEYVKKEIRAVLASQISQEYRQIILTNEARRVEKAVDRAVKALRVYAAGCKAGQAGEK